MANAPGWNKLTDKQKQIALKQWHERNAQNIQGTAGATVGATASAPSRANELVAPGLTRGQLSDQVKAMVGLKYGQAQRDLEAQPARIKDFYSQYQDVIKGAQGQQLQNYDTAVKGVQNLQSGLDQAAQAQWAGQQAAMAADAAKRGASTDSGLADVAHNASNVRNILTGSYGAMLTGQGAVENTRLGNRGVIAEQQKHEVLGQSEKALNDLLREKGQYGAATRSQLISDAASTALKNALTESQISQAGATTAKTEASTQNTRLTNAFLQKYHRLPSSTDPNSPTAKIDKAKLDYYQKHGYFPPTGPPKPAKSGPKTKPASGPGALTPGVEQKRISQVRKISAYFKNGVRGVDPLTKQPTTVAKPGDEKAVLGWLQQQGLDPVAINIGLNLYRNNGKLNPWGVTQAHKYGIHVGGNFQIDRSKTGANANANGATGQVGI